MNRRVLCNIERLNYLLGGVLIAASAVFCTRPQALGVLVGALLSALNFSVLRRVIEGWLTGAAKGDHKTGFFLIPKMVGLMVLVFLAIHFLQISGVAFVIGFSVFLVSIAIETIRVTTNPPSEQDQE